MTKDLARWMSGREATPIRLLALILAGVLGMLSTWWFPLYQSETLVTAKSVAVTNWEVVPAAAAVVWLVWCSPQMPTWERLGPAKLRWYAGGACAVGLLIPVVVATLAWWWLNNMPIPMVPFYHRVFLIDGERIADQDGAALSLAHLVTGGIALTALAGIGICFLGRIAGVSLAAALWTGLVLAQSSLGQFFWLRAPNHRAFGTGPAVSALTLAALCLVAWWLTRGSKGRRWR